MKEETKQKLEIWLSLYPESNHFYDEERKFDLVKTMYDNADIINYDDLFTMYSEKHPDYEKDKVRDLCEHWDLELDVLKRFAEYLLKGTK